MTHTYSVTGMTCTGCSTKVQGLLEKVSGITGVQIDLDGGKAELTMARHIPTPELQLALAAYPKYQLNEIKTAAPPPEETRSFWSTYKPILLVFAYIAGATFLGELAFRDEKRELLAPFNSLSFIYYGIDWMRWMRHFMAGFFLVFSFFKLLDVRAFSAAYQGYDVLARRWPAWGFLYPFVELGLGILFLLNFNPLITNSLTLAIMGLSTIGVAQSLLAKRQFQCACLGAVFNVPMSNLTLFEDVLMVVMSGGMLLIYV